MLQEFTTWLLGVIVQFFNDLWTFVEDAFISILDLVLTAIVSLLSLIPVPLFLSAGLQSIFANIDPSVLYFVGALRLPEMLAMFGAAYLFRLGRKVVTLFQW